jgi:hypothetical protein
MTVSPSVQAVLAVVVGASLVVLLTELQKRVWSGGYFGMRAFLTGFEYQVQPSGRAILVRAAIPFVSGAVTAVLAPDDAVMFGAIAAAAGTLAIAWPVFLSPEVIPPELYGREAQLRFLHLMYAATATVLGFAGALGWVALRSVAGEDLLRFGGEVVRELVVKAIGAALLFAAGVFALRAQARRSTQIKDEATSDAVRQQTPDDDR